MSTETNLALVRRAVDEIWNGLDLDLADDLVDPFYINHGGIIPDLVTGPESMKFAVVLQHTAFPHLEVRERAAVAEGNIVELAWTASRFPRSRGDTDRAPVFIARGTSLIRCADELIAESWTTWDCRAQGNVIDSDPSLWVSTGPYRLVG